MATNIKKNVHILECIACGKNHVVDKGMVSFSFECEGCKNEIYVNESGIQTVIGTLKMPEIVVVDPENGNESGKEKVVKESKKPDETNEFELMHQEKG